MELNREENDDAGEGDTSGESSGQDVVVFFPPGRFVMSEVPHEAEGHVKATGVVGQVQWSPE